MSRATAVQSKKSKQPSKRVVILGGGVGGMTAAHELVERGFEVVVYEMRDTPGGKARSIDVPNSATGNRKPLPGEHGFRFFPGFYKHLPDTMKRIPFENKRVYDNLVLTEHTLIARQNGDGDLQFPSQPPMKPWHILGHFKTFFRSDIKIPDADLKKFATKLLVLLTSCHARRLVEYENSSWLQFVGAEGRDKNDAYMKYCADGLTRALVACQAEKMSARTGGCILLQLLFDLVRPGIQANRVLNGPTSEVWLNPWLDYLRDCGKTKFQFHPSSKVEQIHFADGLVTGVTISRNGERETVQGDYYISALPVEVLEPAAVDNTVGTPQPLVTAEMKAYDASLRNLDKLRTEWMNGIQFYLNKDAQVVRGHTLYIDSAWSLTSISQQQFWQNGLEKYGDGQVKGILSVDISNWNEPGSNGKKARECSREEIKDEVWKQIKDALNDDGQKELDSDVQVLQWFLDPAIQVPNPNTMENAEPLLINTAGSWQFRPRATTRIKNFFLAADFVRTNTDLATMESANEAARRAVNGILRASRSWKKRCRIWRLEEPSVFALFKWYDSKRFRHKPSLPHSRGIILLALVVAVPLWYALRFISMVHYAIVDRIFSPVWQWIMRRVRKPQPQRSTA